MTSTKMETEREDAKWTTNYMMTVKKRMIKFSARIFMLFSSEDKWRLATGIEVHNRRRFKKVETSQRSSRVRHSNTFPTPVQRTAIIVSVFVGLKVIKLLTYSMLWLLLPPQRQRPSVFYNLNILLTYLLFLIPQSSMLSTQNEEFSEASKQC